MGRWEDTPRQITEPCTRSCQSSLALGHNQVSDTLNIAKMYISRGADSGCGSFRSSCFDQRDLCELHVNTMYQSLLKWLRIQMSGQIWATTSHFAFISLSSKEIIELILTCLLTHSRRSPLHPKYTTSRNTLPGVHSSSPGTVMVIFIINGSTLSINRRNQSPRT